MGRATDNDRREVARRLRECRGGWSSGECYYTIINTLGLPDTSREDGGAALYARLADLIEPREPKDRGVAEVKVDSGRLRKERVFIARDGSCPFRKDNRCNTSCASFIECGNVGRCRLIDGSGGSANTGSFYERERKPYGNYH